MMNSLHQQLISQFNECFASFSAFDQLLDDLTRLREQSQFFWLQNLQNDDTN